MKVMEYDIDIKVTKLVKGKGLCEQLVAGFENERKTKTKVFLVTDDQDQDVAPALGVSWVHDMTHFLQIGEFPLGLDKAKRRYFRLLSIPYVLTDNVLFRKDLNGVLLRCIDQDQVDTVLHELHDGTIVGHFAPRTIVWKIMRVGYYWPGMFKDSHAWARQCVKCAIFARKERLSVLPLQPIQVEQPFMRWGIDFIGPINPPSSAGHRWVLTAINYFTRWIEAVALKEANENVVLKFYDDLVTIFGVPKSIISDNSIAFVGLRVSDQAVRNGIYLNTSSNYYPQGNGLAKSTNKNLIRIIKRLMEDNQRAWHTKLKSDLWADRITPKRSIGNSPYVLVYGKETRLLLSIELLALDIMHQLEMFEQDPLAVRYAQLMELEETRSKAMKSLEYHQLQTKRVFDKKSTPRVFREGDVVLKWDELKSKPVKHTKFDNFWSGPFVITKCKEHNSFHLSKMDGDILPLIVNGLHLKRCFEV